jgi:hypothetical protein
MSTPDCSRWSLFYRGLGGSQVVGRLILSVSLFGPLNGLKTAVLASWLGAKS